MLRALKI